ncbi:hypothetical protein K490DRAFT_54363 [Saccharata proteae CBS 121410]|uniref:Uncharacterized protein n=1 Tax=Saccharata proteae CBS 121410 TaxID=1314787 RepID=A0A9P4LYI3_9PEZI|nr:hypothetical protein K490DRAFT_54363 [Saccharata proteae CBS 121410]
MSIRLSDGLVGGLLGSCLALPLFIIVILNSTLTAYQIRPTFSPKCPRFRCAHGPNLCALGTLYGSQSPIRCPTCSRPFASLRVACRAEAAAETVDAPLTRGTSGTWPRKSSNFEANWDKLRRLCWQTRQSHHSFPLQAPLRR